MTHFAMNYVKVFYVKRSGFGCVFSYKKTAGFFLLLAPKRAK